MTKNLGDAVTMYTRRKRYIVRVVTNTSHILDELNQDGDNVWRDNRAVLNTNTRAGLLRRNAPG